MICYGFNAKILRQAGFSCLRGLPGVHLPVKPESHKPKGKNTSYQYTPQQPYFPVKLRLPFFKGRIPAEFQF